MDFESLCICFERNFNGIDRRLFVEVVRKFFTSSCRVWNNFMKLRLESRGLFGIVADAFHDADSETRYKLLIDESDDDSMMRLIQIEGLLDSSKESLKVYKLSDFPEDGQLQMINLVSGVKLAAQRGSLAVLSRTEQVNESFYDLYNMNFKEVRTSTEVKRYANVAVGGISKPCEVHADFKIIVHMTKKEADQAPAPFLSRFEKFRLGQSDVLEAGLERIEPKELAECVGFSRSKLFELEAVVGTKSFFGAVEKKTSGEPGLLPPTPSPPLERSERKRPQLALLFHTLLRPRRRPLTLIHARTLARSLAIESVFVDMIPRSAYGARVEGMKSGSGSVCVEETDEGNHAAAELKGLHENLCRFFSSETNIKLGGGTAAAPSEMQLQSIVESSRGGDNHTNEDDGASIEDLMKCSPADFSELVLSSAAGKRLMQQWILHHAVSRLLQVATPEAIFVHRNRIPRAVFSMYFGQEHFGIRSVVEQNFRRGGNFILYTRTGPALHNLPTVSINDDASTLDEDERRKFRTVVHSSEDKIELTAIFRLAAFSTESSFSTALEEFCKSNRRLLLIVVDMDLATEQRVNFVRLKIETLNDTMSSINNSKLVMLLLHFPASRAVLQGGYPALFLAGWEHLYIDSLGSRFADAKMWCEAAMHGGERMTELLGTVKLRMQSYIEPALQTVLSRFSFQGGPGRRYNSRSMSFMDRHEALVELFGARISCGEEESAVSLKELCCERFQTILEEGDLAMEVARTAEEISSGCSHLSLSESLEGFVDMTFCNFVACILSKVNVDMNLEVLASDIERTTSVGQLFVDVFKALPRLPSLSDLKRQDDWWWLEGNRGAQGAQPDDYRVVFPFFKLVVDRVKSLLKDSGATVAELESDTNEPTVAVMKKSIWAKITGDGATDVDKVIMLVSERVAESEQLWLAFLEQYIQWELHLPTMRSCGLIVKWLQQAEDMGMHGLGRDLVGACVAGHYNHAEMTRNILSFELIAHVVTEGGLQDKIDLSADGDVALLSINAFYEGVRSGVAYGEEDYERMGKTNPP